MQYVRHFMYNTGMIAEYQWLEEIDIVPSNVFFIVKQNLFLLGRHFGYLSKNVSYTVPELYSFPATTKQFSKTPQMWVKWGRGFLCLSARIVYGTPPPQYLSCVERLYWHICAITVLYCGLSVHNWIRFNLKWSETTEVSMLIRQCGFWDRHYLVCVLELQLKRTLMSVRLKPLAKYHLKCHTLQACSLGSLYHRFEVVLQK